MCKRLLCKVAGCGREQRAKGLCLKHYNNLFGYNKRHPDKPISVDDYINNKAAIKPEIDDNGNKKACSVEGCDRDYYCKGFCRNHGKQFQRFNSKHPELADAIEAFYAYLKGRKESLPCNIKGCTGKAGVKGLCNKHNAKAYRQMRRFGHTDGTDTHYVDVCWVPGCNRLCTEFGGICEFHKRFVE